jgi:uncharacterized caspase-like protein
MSTIPMSRFWAVLFLMVGMGSLSTIHSQTASTQRGVQEATQTPSSSSSSSPSPIGPYYALIIGNNNYKELNKLQTAVGDAKALEQLLREGFGFQTRTLYDATRSQILDALDDYQSTLPEKSNLLIYYAGHGNKDVAAHRAYWLPVDAQRNHSPNWINAVEITDKLRAIPARHVLVIADSCWSGDLAMRSGGAFITSLEHNAVLARSLTLKSRHIMSSGGDEPVADGGGGGHSVFTGALLQSLNDMDGDSFTAESLLVQRIKPRVAGRSEQTPEYAMIRDSDADLGDFVFFRSKSKGSTPQVRADVPPTPEKTPDQPVRSDKPVGNGDGHSNVHMAELQSFSPPAMSTLTKSSVDDAADTTGGTIIDSRFKIGGSPDAETVLDMRTGLMWTRADYWNIKKSFSTRWNDAMNWAKEMNAVAYAGYSDWTVPNVEQYRTINRTKADRETYLRVFQKTDATDFWTSRSISQFVASYVDFKEGWAVSGDKTGKGSTVGGAIFPVSVRLVRVANPRGSFNRGDGPLPGRNQPAFVAQRRNKKTASNRVKGD